MERWRDKKQINLSNISWKNLSKIRVQGLDWRLDLKVHDVVRRNELVPIDWPRVMMTHQTIHRMQHYTRMMIWGDERVYLLVLFWCESLRDKRCGRRRGAHGGLPKLDEFS